MADLEQLKKRARASLEQQRGGIGAAADFIRGREFTPDELSQEMRRLQFEDERAKEFSEKKQQEAVLKAEQEGAERLDKEYAQKEMGFGSSIDPKVLEYGYNLFGLGPITGNNKSIPMLPSTQTPLIQEEVPAERKPANTESSEAAQPVIPAQQRQPAAEKMESTQTLQQNVAAPEAQAQQADIEKMILKSQEDEDNAALLKQAAKLRNAAMGAGSGTILKTDTSLYDEMQKKAKRPLENLLLKDELKDKKAKNDPNSQISKLARESLNKLGMNMSGFENVPFSQLEKFYPSLTQSLYTKIVADAKKEENSLRRSERADAKLNKLDVDRQKDLYKHIDTAMVKLQKDFNEYDRGRAQVDVAKELYEGVRSGRISAGSADLVSLYNLIKAVDPGSVVKEGEIKLAQSAQSLWGKIQTKGMGAFEGALLDPKTRDSFSEILNAIQKSREIEFARKKAQFVQAGVSKGLDKDILEEGIYGGPSGVDSSKYLKSTQKEESISLPQKYEPGQIVKLKNGDQYIVQEDGVTGVKK